MLNPLAKKPSVHQHPRQDTGPVKNGPGARLLCPCCASDRAAAQMKHVLEKATEELRKEWAGGLKEDA